MKVDKINLGVYAVNCYILTCEESNKTAIIDPGGSADQLLKYINNNCLEVEYIILTHAHGDHIGAVPELKNKLDNVKIILNKNDNYMLKDKTHNLSFRMPGPDVEMSADILVNHNDKLNLGELELTFIHTPGHTKGSMCIAVKDVLFAGDTLFARSIGRTDLEGGDFDAIIRSIKNKLFSLPDDITVYPGHGAETSIGIEKEKNTFVK